MKKQLTLALILSSAMALSACGGGGSDTGTAGGSAASTATSQANLQDQLAAMPTGELSSEETAGLLMMREEEKMAGDIYYTLFDMYGQNIFKNIGDSEQGHAEAMRILLERYQIQDPVGTNGRGQFTDPNLQATYDSLIAKGMTDLLSALYVGAEVEELDIRDIAALIQQVENNDDIVLVYENLLKGSRNHLRSFHKQIANNGGNYVPQYITQAEYDAIVNSPTENGAP